MNPAADSATADSTPPFRRWPWILGILALALVLRLPGYDESVWIDELYTSNLFCGDPIVLLKTLYSDIHPPAYFVFIHFWNGLFGDGEVWLRLPALLCGLLSIVLVWRLGETFAGRAAGVMAAFLLAVSPVHIWYSQEGRPYSASMFLLLLTLLAFYRLLQGPRRFWWAVLYFGALTGVVFTHYYMASFPFVFAGLALLRKTENRRGILVTSGLVLALCGGYMAAKMYFSSVPTSKGYLRGFDVGEAWQLGFRWFLTGNSFDPYTSFGELALLVLQGLGVVVFGLGVWRLATSKPAADAPAGIDVVVHMLVLPVFLFVLNVVGLDQTYIERSAVPALPLFVIVLAAGATGWRSRVVAQAVAAFVVVASAVVLFAFFTRGDRWTVYKPNPDWRGAATWLGAELDRDSGPHVLYSDYISPTALTYYDVRMQEMKKFERNDRKIRRLVDASTGIFGTEGFPGAQIQTAIEQRLAAFDALMLFLYERGTRLAIHELMVHDPFAETAPRTTFWLLVHGDPSPRARAVLADKRVQVAAQKSFRSLAVYKLRRVD